MEHIELSTTAILALFETSKEDRTSFVNHLVDSLERGESDPLKVKLQIFCMLDMITQLTDRDPKKNKNAQAAIRFTSLVLDAAQPYGKEFELHQGKFKVGEFGTKYDYAGTGDGEIVRLLEQQKELDAKVKARQEFLKTLPYEGFPILDKATGELVTVFPPAKTSTTSVSVSLK